MAQKDQSNKNYHNLYKLDKLSNHAQVFGIHHQNDQVLEENYQKTPSPVQKSLKTSSLQDVLLDQDEEDQEGLGMTVLVSKVSLNIDQTFFHCCFGCS